MSTFADLDPAILARVADALADGVAVADVPAVLADEMDEPADWDSGAVTFCPYV